MNKRVENAIRILPLYLREIFNFIDEKVLEKLEEIRLRINAPIILHTANDEFFLSKNGICSFYEYGIIPSESDFISILESATKNSLYAYMEDIKNGFITIEGGHRIGICGTAVMVNDEIKNIKDIRFINIRIANEIIGVSNFIINKIHVDNRIKNTLIISPPKAGKTTLLRDIARNLSHIKGIKIALIDERGELSSVYKGIPQNDVGLRTFVMTGYSKKDGFMHAIRALSPTVLITDEIGSAEDINSVYTAINSGVKVITSVHGDNVLSIRNKEGFKTLFKNKVFEVILVLNINKKDRIEKILDGDLIEI